MVTWGMFAGDATELVDRTLAALATALPVAAGRLPFADEALVERCVERVEALQMSRTDPPPA